MRPRRVVAAACLLGTLLAAVPAPAMAADHTRITAEGFRILRGRSHRFGHGPLRTYTVEVQRAIRRYTPARVAAKVTATLEDRRSWTHRRGASFRRVGTTRASIRIVLARPRTVDRYCALAGLDTAGRYSCWNGRMVMLNLARWKRATPAWPKTRRAYRAMVVNHEVGHALGWGHMPCPRPGALAPVMMQQTKGLDGCRANAWPFPKVG